ncbi:MAG TPA: hypothetical protein DD670_21500 [Planctomycetaceae bacterium]|nr:hypothetical protein [Planctomycetaceae bacterium]
MLCFFGIIACAALAFGNGDDVGDKADSTALPLLLSEDFEQGADRWKPTDANVWRIVKTDRGKLYEQWKKRSQYEPPHRSPYNISLLKNTLVGDFVLTARVKNTARKAGNHRDVCLFFNYQGPARFYYAHLGLRPDPNSSQIMIVNDAPRKMITKNKTPGIPWDDEWHEVKVVRRVDEGTIEIYFDDMKKPNMVAIDKTFTWGQIGIGSFDDTAQWDDIKLHGQRVEKPLRRADTKIEKNTKKKTE